MKIKTNYFLLWLSLITFQCYAQKAENSSLGVVYGMTAKGDGFQLFYNYGITDRNEVQGVIQYSKSEFSARDLTIPVEYFGLQVNYLCRIMYDQNMYQVDIGGGLNLGQELINKGQTNLSDGGIINTSSNTVYGANLALDIEIFFGRSLSGIIKATQYYHKNSDLGQFTPFVGLGLKYILF